MQKILKNDRFGGATLVDVYSYNEIIAMGNAITDFFLDASNLQFDKEDVFYFAKNCNFFYKNGDLATVSMHYLKKTDTYLITTYEHSQLIFIRKA